jgi:hypothetical protein
MRSGLIAAGISRDLPPLLGGRKGLRCWGIIQLPFHFEIVAAACSARTHQQEKPAHATVQLHNLLLRFIIRLSASVPGKVKIF